MTWPSGVYFGPQKHSVSSPAHTKTCLKAFLSPDLTVILEGNFHYSPVMLQCISFLFHSNYYSELLHPFLQSRIDFPDALFAPVTNLVKGGVRNSAADVFLKPAMDRENLHVVLNAEVTRVR